MHIIGVLTLALLLPAVFLGPAALPVQDGHEADEQAIRGVMDGFMDAWNHHDAKTWTALFSEDAEFTNVRGVGASGRKDIEEFHARVFATIFKNSHQKYTAIKTRFIRPDVAEVDVHWEMTGPTDPAGNPVPLRLGLLNFVMTRSEMARTDEKWQIVVMHNMDLPGPAPTAK